MQYKFILFLSILLASVGLTACGGATTTPASPSGIPCSSSRTAAS